MEFQSTLNICKLILDTGLKRGSFCLCFWRILRLRQYFACRFCVVVTDSLPDRSCLMREPACQRFDQFHPRDARRLHRPPIAGPLPSYNPSWFLILVLFWSLPILSSCLLILFPIRSAGTSKIKVPRPIMFLPHPLPAHTHFSSFPRQCKRVERESSRRGRYLAVSGQTKVPRSTSNYLEVPRSI